MVTNSRPDWNGRVRALAGMARTTDMGRQLTGSFGVVCGLTAFRYAYRTVGMLSTN